LNTELNTYLSNDVLGMRLDCDSQDDFLLMAVDATKPFEMTVAR
tara:strand:- start:392 stop:523 length:132 start_codon:yes stop_codon:yes gene_type:complete